jgi:hypothetical protein
LEIPRFSLRAWAPIGGDAMPRLSVVKTNFTAGEFSPRLAGRTDIDRHANAARTLINAHPVIHGGAKRRAGTRFVAATKFSGTKKSRLIPFVFSRDVAFMIEIGDSYMRMWPAGGGTYLAELASPYTEAMLSEVDYAQGADTMFMAHASVPVQRLRRFGGAAFDLGDAPFTTTPFAELGHALPTGVTLSASSVGAGRTLTAPGATWLPSDVGRQFVAGAGLAIVTGYTSPTVLVVDISIGFAGTSLASGAWKLDSSPQAILKPSAKDPVASVIDLVSSVSRAADLTLSAKTGAITVTASAGVFAPGDVGLSVYADSGVATITGYTSPTIVSATTISDFISTTYSAGGYGITQSAWRSEDVGKFVRINGGLCRITSLVSSVAVKATLLTSLTGTVAAPPLAWSLESSVWSASAGYPRTLTLHEQRLVAAGSNAWPQTIWGSRTAEYLDFTKGTNDDDSYSFTIAADEVNPISYLASLRNMVVHTYGGEFSLQGGVEKPITPTNVRIRPESAHGSKGVRPVTIGKESVFVQRAGRKVRAMGYRYDVDGYQAPDLSSLAEHITASGVVGMAYQQEPDMLLWAVRTDGALLSCTIDRDQQVTGWARHYTEGAFEAIATIPNGERDETWAIVRRTVDGQTVRYLEIMDDTWQPLLTAAPDPDAYPPTAEPTVYGMTADCALSFDSVDGEQLFSVPHLIGKTVDIVADGSVLPQQVVQNDGSVTLPRAAFRVLIGLHFRSEIGLLTPEVGTGTGTAQGNAMSTHEVSLRFLETIGATVLDGEGNAQVMPFRQFGEAVLDQPPAPFTGAVRIEMLGWDIGRSEITVVQDQPLPMHLLSVVRKFTVND